MPSADAAPFDALFRAFTLGPIDLQNRFVMPAMQRGWCLDGAMLPEAADYYAKRVKGGVGLIIGESAAIDHPSSTCQQQVARINPATVASWKACVEAVKAAGGHMLLQLWHEGALRNHADGLTRSPSGTGFPGHAQGSAGSKAELADIRDAYVRSAVLARDAGADGVEIHAAHGYFLDQFLWARTNLRTDDYGGTTLAERGRYPVEIVRSIRAACGSDFLISFRFSQWKEHDFGAAIANDPDDLAAFLILLRSAGVDVLHASTRRFWESAWPEDPRTLAEWAHALSGLPTIAVGSVGLDRDVMESFSGDGEASSRLVETLTDLNRRIEQDAFQLVAAGRSLISDANFVNKVRRGALSEVRTFVKDDIAYLEWEGLPR